MARTPLRLPFDRARCRELRERCGLLQQDLADRMTELGKPVTRSSIANWENGRSRPAPPYLPVLARALNAEIDDLLTPDPERDLAADVTRKAS